MADTEECPPKVCEPGGRGLFLPALDAVGEQEWPHALRAVLYLAGLAWLFMGVAIVSDIFMGAIERITSKKRRVTLRGTDRKVTVKVWNDTVANLTLMALGSSAPEIMLSVIELTLLPPQMMAGDLGPSTIVGSAAFNLFCITAVCVVAIPNGEVRYIKDMTVFTVTASFSIFAYLWLVVIIQLFSPDVIEIWEGAVTLALFPLLVFVSYLADVGYFNESVRRLGTTVFKVNVAELTKEELATISMRIRQQHGGNITDEHLLRLVEKEADFHKSRGHYRVGAIRAMVGGRRMKQASNTASERGKPRGFSSVVPMYSSGQREKPQSSYKETDAITFSFTAGHYAVMENIGSLLVAVDRKGALDLRAWVEYATRDGTALEGSDYNPVSGVLEFAPGEERHTISVSIIDDNTCEEDEHFFIDLSNPRTEAAEDIAAVGPIGTTCISIIDDDCPGTLSFRTESGLDELRLKEGSEPKTHEIVVQRKEGAVGTIRCMYGTEEASALKNTDFEHVEGELQFEPGQMTATIAVTILPRGRYDSSAEFRLVLSEPSQGVKFDAKRDGGEDTQILTVIIETDALEKDRVDKLMNKLQIDYAQHAIAYSNWREQFKCAVLVNGGDDDEPSCMDKVMHVITVFWKVLFATIPPADYCDGWLCFFCSLLFIGIVTALIGDIAALVGCVLGVQDSFTAITLVAMGTSLPDTFASKMAAQQDRYADASIGNVTGSNCVNVFLGLGLPWVIGSVYWHVMGQTPEWKEKYRSARNYDDWQGQGGRFVVIGGDLCFSVIVFVVTALICIATLLLRRRFVGGELGGSRCLKYSTSLFFVFLWFAYIAASIVYSIANTATSECR